MVTKAYKLLVIPSLPRALSEARASSPFGARVQETGAKAVWSTMEHEMKRFTLMLGLVAALLAAGQAASDADVKAALDYMLSLSR